MSLPGNNGYNSNNGYNHNPNQNTPNNNNDYSQGYQNTNGTPNNGYQTANNGYVAPTPPKKKGSKVALIAGASVLTVALLGGGAFAATNVFNKLSDKDIAQAMPGNASMFGEVDLNPSNEQKLGLLSVSKKINAISEDETVKETKDPKEMATDGFFGELDYEADVAPWIGDKAAFGSWGELPWGDNDIDSELLEMTSPDYSEEAFKKQMDQDTEANAVVIYEIKNKDKAEEAVKKTSEKYYVVTKDYLAIASSEASLDSYKSSLSSSTLKDNTDFISDRKSLHTDNVATGWVDLKKLGLEKSPEFAKYTENGIKIDGRVVSGITLSEGKVSNVTKLIGFESDKFAPTDAQKGLKELNKLPSDTLAAFSVAGLDASLKSAWEKNKGEIEDNYEYSSMLESLEEYGISLPEDFTKIVGTEFALGVGGDSFDAMSDVKVTARIADGDEVFYQKVLEDMGSDEDFTVTKDNKAVVLNYQGGGSGSLGDNDNFKKAVGDTSKSQVVAYADLDKIMAAYDVEDKPNTTLGSIGMNGSYDKADNVSTLTTNWIY